MAQFIRPAEGRLTSFFGGRIHPIIKKWTGHHGIDIANSAGTPIHATAAGTVRWARSDGLGGTYGNVVVIKHAGGWESLYAHMQKYTVRAGQKVKQGQVIGYIGNTGGSTGPHLHFEMHKGGWNKYYSNEVDPLEYYPDPGVLELQKKLNTVGIEVQEDSYFGEKTKSAVRLYQSRRGLTVDGSPGPATMADLNKLAAERKAQTAAKPKPTPKPVPTPPKKEMDEMVQLLPATQKKDMRDLLQKAYDDKVFTVNHADKVDKMTRGQALDLLISYNARKK